MFVFNALKTFLCVCDKVISGCIRRSSNLDGKGSCWLEERTNICFGMKIFTGDEYAEAAFGFRGERMRTERGCEDV